MALYVLGYDIASSLPYIGISIISILVAILAFVVGYGIILFAVHVFKKSMNRTKLPKLLVEFLSRLLKILLVVMLILAVLPILGIDVSAIVIGVSAVIGLILGFGLQDTMTNIFAGFWLAMLKPFEIGDYIEVNGVGGTLSSVGVMSTSLITPDNKYIMIPNKLVWGATIVNHSKMPVRRVAINVGISYKSNLDKAFEIATMVMKKHPLVLEEPEPSVVITELADSSINLQLRAWCNTSDYWTVMGEITKEIYEEFSKEGVEIPYPQLDVHIKEKD